MARDLWVDSKPHILLKSISIENPQIVLFEKRHEVSFKFESQP